MNTVLIFAISLVILFLQRIYFSVLHTFLIEMSGYLISYFFRGGMNKHKLEIVFKLVKDPLMPLISRCGYWKMFERMLRQSKWCLFKYVSL
jgi:hypothetical protein